MKALVKEIERFPEHDDHQKADQFAEQQAIEPPKIAGNNADSQIQPPFNPRSPGIRKVAIAGIEHIDNATGDRYVRDDTSRTRMPCGRRYLLPSHSVMKGWMKT